MNGKRVLVRHLYRSGAYRWVGHRYGGCGVIFMLHSVVDDADVYLREPMRCTVEVLDRVMRQLDALEIEIVALDTALRWLGDCSAPRFAVLTFDDGYRDNASRAVPILEKYAAPATIYVTTSFIERTGEAWWLGLVEWLKRRERITVEGFGIHSTATVAEKISARIKLSAWVQGDAGRLDALGQAMKADGLDSRPLVDQQALTRDELRRLAKHPLITIGGHTTSHPWLASLSTEEACREIAENRSYLQDLTQQEVAHFAYPYGSPVACAEREATLVAEAGFRSAVTSRHGCIFGAHRNHQFALPREGMQWYDDEASIACKSAGVHRFLRDLKMKRPWRPPVATMMAD